MSFSNADERKTIVQQIRELVLSLDILKASPVIVRIMSKLKDIDYDAQALIEAMNALKFQVAQLKQENAALREELTRKEREIEQLKERINRLSAKPARNGL